jgi:flavodoxin
MMDALVVFESMFGNTEAIARAVGEGLSTRMHTEVIEVGAAPIIIDGSIGLLVVGGPTHAFGMSRPGTRQTAAQQAGSNLVSKGNGLREWLAALRVESAAASGTFDTRIFKPRVPGSAARAAAKRLRNLGFREVATAESFYVRGTDGPLIEGELDRARHWGEQLGSAVIEVKANL